MKKIKKNINLYRAVPANIIKLQSYQHRPTKRTSCPQISVVSSILNNNNFEVNQKCNGPMKFHFATEKNACKSTLCFLLRKVMAFQRVNHRTWMIVG